MRDAGYLKFTITSYFLYPEKLIDKLHLLNMKVITMWIVAVLITVNSFSQLSNSNVLLDSGKMEYYDQYVDTVHNFQRSIEYFKRALAIDPENMEARYFLGYAIDRQNSFDGNTLHQSDRNLAIEASEQFEFIIQKNIKYDGEILTLDPYSKISSIWGSLAQTYLVRKQVDSARWAFAEGKKRGGFLEPVLDFNRKLLNSCAKNAILFTYGDNILIPIWYLQQIENFRTDVTPVDVNLLNTKWYDKWILNSKKIKLSLNAAQIDSTDYLPWQDSLITIKEKGNARRSFSWTVKPSYYDAYILRADWMMLNILENNIFDRVIYFPQSVDSSFDLSLGNHLINDGILSKLILKENDLNSPVTIISPNLKTYTLNSLKIQDINKSPDAVQVLNGYRWAYLINIATLYRKKNYKKAKALMSEMELKYPQKQLPYGTEEFQQYVQQLKSNLN